MASSAARSRDNDDQAAIEWLKLLLAVVAAAALTVIYFLLPRSVESDPVLEFIKACLPNLVTALIVFPTVFVVLGRVGQGAEDRLARVVQRSIGSSAAGLHFPDDVSGTAEFVRELVAKKSSQRVIDIEILAFTGGTFTTALLRDLVRLNPNKLNITLRTIDFARADKSFFPGHWEREEAETVQRLKELCDGNAGLEIWHYPSFPFLLGLTIDQAHLLITFPTWDLRTGKLADKSLEYRYYGRDANSEHLFELFANWVNQPGQTLLHAKPQT
ncbi:hypothetical protein AB0H12_07070 [Actinosynnema sp. NPDC023794]